MLRNQYQDSPFRDILQNRTNGASALLHQFLDHAENQTDEDILAGLNACQDTFPMMAVWKSVLAQFRQSEHSLTDIACQFRQQTLETIRSGARVLGEYGRILTLSNSSVVRQAITSADPSPKVLCAESLPGSEGADQANALRISGIESVLVEDDSLLDRVHEVDSVVLGADLWTQSGFINKIGSKNLIDHAEPVDIPVFILAEEFKRVDQVPDLKTSLIQPVLTPNGKTTHRTVFEFITWRPHIRLISNTGIIHPSSS